MRHIKERMNANPIKNGFVLNNKYGSNPLLL